MIKTLKNWVFGLLLNPKETLSSIYEPQTRWRKMEGITAGAIIFFESFIFIFSLVFWWGGSIDFTIILPQVGILFCVILLPFPLISKNFLCAIIWHAVILVIPSIICLIIICLLSSLAIVDMTLGTQIYESTAIMICLLCFGIWALVWKLFSHVILLRKYKNGKPQVLKMFLFFLVDGVVLSCYLVNFFYFYQIW
jgi:hypothetical protein